MRDVLDAEVDAGGGRFRGIRHGVAGTPTRRSAIASRVVPPHLVRDATFREGFAELGKLGLTFESWQYHPQLADAIDLGARLPRHHHHSNTLNAAAATAMYC